MATYAELVFFASANRHLLSSSIILIFSLVLLLYLLYWFAHARMLTADLAEFEHLRQQGTLSGDNLEQDYSRICALLDEVAPAACVRQEAWVRVYYYMLRTGRLFTSYSQALEDEMRRLVAYQSMLYRVACSRLAELRP